MERTTGQPMSAATLGAPYRRVWWANTVSGLGDGAFVTALPLLAVTVTRDPRLIALVSAAAILNLDPSGRIVDARIALGGVAPKPWRIPAAEQILRGKIANDSIYGEAAEALVKGAQALRYNAFKVELARRITVRARAARTY